MSVESVLVIGGPIVISLISNAVFGSDIGNISRQRELAITPYNTAFSIWGLIYTLLIITCVYASSTNIPRFTSYSVGVSLLLSALWVPVFTRNSKNTLVVSSVILWASFAAAFAAVYKSERLDFQDWRKILALQSPIAIYAGWLCCAATLGTGIAFDALGISIPTWSLSLLCILVSALSIISNNAILVLPVLWALAWQKKITAQILVNSAILILAAVFSQLK